jgi:hypothetical protein
MGGFFLTLNHYLQPRKKVSLKAALRRMRSMWLKGEVNRFDLKLSRILQVSLEEAAEIREKWESMGFLAYNEQGLLRWRSGGF